MSYTRSHDINTYLPDVTAVPNPLDSSKNVPTGLRMPAEFEPHHGCILIWPSRPGSWPYGAKAARRAFRQVIEAIAESESVYVLAGPDCIKDAAGTVGRVATILPIETDDAWARDVGPTFVLDSSKNLIGIDWEFNAWGGKVDGLYAHWDRDDAAAAAICQALKVPCLNLHPFVLEGGSIHSDGDGTLMVTESCLLSAGRNPQMTREQIEEKLCRLLGAQKILWLPRGIWQDETNEHVDNIAAFVRPGEVVLAWTDDETDPQYSLSKSCLDYLSSEKDAKGRELIVHKLPIPSQPICVQEEDLDGYEFEDGEDIREAGERLAASYVNFYISNGGIILPQFGDANDSRSVEILSRLFPERTVYPIPAGDILLGGGNIHCITQQIPIGRNFPLKGEHPYA